MKITPLPKVSIGAFSPLFTSTATNRQMLDIGVGEGFVQSFKPETGLRVAILDCSFSEGMEFYKQDLSDKEQFYFTLAYFPDNNCLELIKDSDKFQKPLVWNSLFFSAASYFAIAIAPTVRCRCVSISFSKDWLLHVLQSNSTLQDIQGEISRIEKLEVCHNMAPEEREVLEELFLESKQQQHFRSFYIKAAVLKLVGDFLQKLRNEKPFLAKTGLQGTLDEVEQYLNEHITKEFAGTKVLAQHFSVSESTLKRHFRKKFGLTISAYLTGKKMQYARELIQQKGISIAEASRMLGYRSVQHFKENFYKYFTCTPVKESGPRPLESMV